jgi:hypothetical protein
MSVVETRICVACKRSLGLSEFYLIRSSREAAPRAEARCKRCKKKSRKSENENIVSITLPAQKLPDRMIEPDKSKNPTDQLLFGALKTDRVESLDFQLWERLYGYPLKDQDKVEIQTNLMALILVLADERNRQTGDYVELSKSK